MNKNEMLRHCPSCGCSLERYIEVLTFDFPYSKRYIELLDYCPKCGRNIYENKRKEDK